MAGLHEKLLVLFPDYKSGDWEIVDKGDGAQVISVWRRQEAQPTKGTIDAVNDATATSKFREIINNKTITNDPVTGALLRVIARATGQNQANVILMMIEELSK